MNSKVRFLMNKLSAPVNSIGADFEVIFLPEDRLPYLREKTAKLTDSPGVYLMKNAACDIIYIGKAKHLKRRVSSYFRAGAAHPPKVAGMVAHVWDYDFIVTDSEQEALLLECSLIKQHQPKYNILLKDDKGFYYIKISEEAYPRITVEKQKSENGTYAGVYTSGFVAKSMLEEVNTIFRLPTCRRKFPQSFGKGRPCLNYAIRKCDGICRGHMSQEAYQKQVAQAVEYIRNGSKASSERMQKEMQEAADRLEFEKAAVLRDRIRAIEKADAGQKVLDNSLKNADIIAMADNQDALCIAVLVYRGGRLSDKLHFSVSENAEEAVLDAFVIQFYQGRIDLPETILLESELKEPELIKAIFSEQAGHSVKIHVPQRSNGLQLVRMAKKNAMEYLACQQNRTGKELLAVEELGKLLGMEHVPKYIEAYDISNLASESMVAGMVVFENGRPLKKAYKHFRMKEQMQQNDYACMQEVIQRRLSHLHDHTDAGFSRKPDLILLDGGKGHVGAVLPVVQAYAPEIAVFGMVKDKKHRTRAIAADGGEISISGTQSAFQLVTRIQDEVHRYSVAYMHKLHKKRSFSSELTQVKGIGEKRVQQLLLYFKTREALWSADVAQLKAAGIPEKTALALYQYLHQAASEPDENSSEYQEKNQDTGSL